MSSLAPPARFDGVLAQPSASHFVDSRGPIAMPRTGHRTMLDQPLALASAWCALLA